MKKDSKKLLIALAFLAVSVMSFSQSINLRVGPTFSRLNWKTNNADKSAIRQELLAFNIMLGYDWLNLRHFGLSTNLGYIQKGGRDSLLAMSAGPEAWTMRESTFRLHYLSFNTLAVGKCPLSDRFEPFIHAGPRIDYLISYSEPGVLQAYDPLLSHLNRYTWGLIAGGGLDLRFGKLRTGVVFDYWMNINKIVDFVAANGVKHMLNDRTMTVDFHIGYSF